MSLEFRKEYRARDKSWKQFLGNMRAHLQVEDIKLKMKLVPARISCWDMDAEKMESQI